MAFAITWDHGDALDCATNKGHFWICSLTKAGSVLMILKLPKTLHRWPRSVLHPEAMLIFMGRAVGDNTDLHGVHCHLSLCRCLGRGTCLGLWSYWIWVCVNVHGSCCYQSLGGCPWAMLWPESISVFHDPSCTRGTCLGPWPYCNYESCLWFVLMSEVMWKPRRPYTINKLLWQCYQILQMHSWERKSSMKTPMYTLTSSTKKKKVRA